MSETAEQAGVAPPAASDGAEQKQVPADGGHDLTQHIELPTTGGDLANYFNEEEAKRRKEEQEGAGEQDRGQRQGDFPEDGNLPEPDGERVSPEESAEEPSEPDGDNDVLSKRGQKRIKDALRRMGEAEEREKRLQAEIEELREQVNKDRKGDDPDRPRSIYDTLNEATTPDEVEAVRAQAESMLDFVDEHYLDDEFDLDGKTYPRADLLKWKKIANDILQKQIPRRERHLQQQAATEQHARALFPDMENPQTPMGRFYRSTVSDPRFQSIRNAYPNWRHLVGFAYVGQQYVNAQLQAQQGNDGGNQEGAQRPSAGAPDAFAGDPGDEPEAAPQGRRTAQNLPGLRSGSAPSKVTPSASQKRGSAMNELLKQGTVTGDQVADFFNQTAHFR